ENTIISDMKVSNAPGAAFMIIQNGKAVYEKSFGVCNINTNVQVNSFTSFQIGSITKTFTAASGGRLGPAPQPSKHARAPARLNGRVTGE
ncbi:MAG: serine hydrolase domain-containing protein, partial [Salinibacter sp.]